MASTLESECIRLDAANDSLIQSTYMRPEMVVSQGTTNGLLK
jgi:hypothetical protein